MTKPTEDTSPRHIRPGACSWCGHPPHASACSQSIRTGPSIDPPCPCSRRTEGTA